MPLSFDLANQVPPAGGASQPDGQTMPGAGRCTRRVAGILLAITIAALTVGSVTARAATDPRICSLGSELVCAKTAALDAMKRQVVGQIACRGYVGLLRFRCTWANGKGSGWSTVSLGSAPAWHVTVTVGKVWTCAQKPVPGC